MNPHSRRQFLRQLTITAPLLIGASVLGQEAPPATPPAAPPAAPGAGTKVTPDDPVAMALGYVEDAAKVDVAKYPQFKAGSHCENCALYTGQAGAAEGPCTVFQNKIVTAKGWCATWAPKPPATPTPAP